MKNEKTIKFETDYKRAFFIFLKQKPECIEYNKKQFEKEFNSFCLRKPFNKTFKKRILNEMLCTKGREEEIEKEKIRRNLKITKGWYWLKINGNFKYLGKYKNPFYDKVRITKDKCIVYFDGRLQMWYNDDNFILSKKRFNALKKIIKTEEIGR